jgi:predicted dienelactone hydrolase
MPEIVTLLAVPQSSLIVFLCGNAEQWRLRTRNTDVLRFTLLAAAVGWRLFAAGPPDMLPAPSGEFKVGRITVEWTDRSRLEPLSPNHEPRALMVDIWYPADAADGPPESYLNATAFEAALGADGFTKQFGTAADAIRRGAVRTHAAPGAHFAASAKRCPVLIFSPGGGMVREVYAAQLEDLASHGYVVAAISHPYDAIATVFPDGRTILYSGKRWPGIPSVEGEVNLNQLEWHARDIRFVLEQLSQAQQTGSPSVPFARYLDLTRVGAFGHSFGGEAAARACQIDPHLKACLDQDGLAGMRPFNLDPRDWGMDQAFMLIERSGPTGPLSEKDLAEMKLTRESAENLLLRLRAYQEQVMRSTGGGSWRVILDRQATTHMDFSDLPLIGAFGGPDAEARVGVIQIIRSLTRAFFDKTLRGLSAPELDARGGSGLVQALEFFPLTRRR